ncbi:MAG: glycosyltransferase family 2 protein [Halorhabdus sp.]
MDSVTVVIPVRDEGDRIGGIVTTLVAAYDVIVVDDGSSDDTVPIASTAGATVIEHDTPRGWAASLRTGFEHASGDIVVTFEATGEYDPGDIERVLEPIENGDADVVFGSRAQIPRFSEHVLNRVVCRRLDVPDASSELRAIRASLLEDIEVGPKCGCGVIALEAAAQGAVIESVPVSFRTDTGPQDLAWHHLGQLVGVLRRL